MLLLCTFHGQDKNNVVSFIFIDGSIWWIDQWHVKSKCLIFAIWFTEFIRSFFCAPNLNCWDFGIFYTYCFFDIRWMIPFWFPTNWCTHQLIHRIIFLRTGDNLLQMRMLLTLFLSFSVWFCFIVLSFICWCTVA